MSQATPFTRLAGIQRSAAARDQGEVLGAEHGLDLADVTLVSASLEDVFISLTGRALR